MRKRRPQDTDQIVVTSSDLVAPEYYGDAQATQVMTGGAAPLLVAASVTITGVIVQEPGSLRWPGMTLFFLTVTIVTLMVCVQVGFLARRYTSTPDEVRSWWTRLPETERENRVAADTMSDRFELQRLTELSRWTYGAGIVLIWVAVGCALAPPADAAQPGWRWAAVAIAWSAALLEVLWLAISRRR